MLSMLPLQHSNQVTGLLLHLEQKYSLSGLSPRGMSQLLTKYFAQSELMRIGLIGQLIDCFLDWKLTLRKRILGI